MIHSSRLTGLWEMISFYVKDGAMSVTKIVRGWVRDAGKVQDKHVWRCVNRNCGGYKYGVSIRNDIIYQSKLSPQEYLHVIYCWSCEFPEMMTAAAQTNVSRRTIQEMFRRFWSFLKCYLDQFMGLERNNNKKFASFYKLIPNRYVRGN